MDRIRPNRTKVFKMDQIEQMWTKLDEVEKMNQSTLQKYKRHTCSGKIWFKNQINKIMMFMKASK